MNNLVDLIREKTSDAIENLGYEIYHIEYVNEFGHNYLRIMITNQETDKKINITDCEIVSKTINRLIDDLGIDNKFFLEVSSPGINRKLYTFKHMKDAVDKIVCVKLNKSNNGSKKHIGILKDVNDGEIILGVKDEELKINIDTIKNINLEEISQEDIL